MNVLIIDSHPVYIEGLSVVLKRIDSGCRTFSASSLNKGLSILSNSDSTIDLLILGINTQSMEEVCQLEELTSANGSLAIVVISAVIDSRQSRMLLEMGVKGVVPKFYSTDKMILAFRECCSGRVHVPPEAKSAINRLDTLDSNRSRITSRLHLTKRQLQVLELMEDRMSNGEIAEKLSVSLATVKTHVNRLYSALGVCGRKQCIQRSYDLGVLYRS